MSEDNILESVHKLLGRGDVNAAREMIETGGTPGEIAGRYKEVLLDQYWKAKSLAGAVAIGQCGISYCMGNAVDLRGDAKQMAYNLGSFCWPGWDEAGIKIGESDLAVGAEAAKLNLRLAIELNKSARGMSNAHWLIGAYALVARDGKSAVSAFGQALALAPEDARELNLGYVAIARLMENADDSTGLKDLLELFAGLDAQQTEDSKFTSGQLRTAAKVFLGESINAAVNKNSGSR